ncbi:uncharacterized protein M6G45_010211 [Spheniscus humboldti]
MPGRPARPTSPRDPYPDSSTIRPGTPDSGTQRQQLPLMPGRPAHPTSPRAPGSELSHKCPGGTNSKPREAPALAELHARVRPWTPTVSAGRRSKTQAVHQCTDKAVWGGTTCFGEGFLCVRESSPGEKAPRGPIARSSRRQKWIPTCNGNVSHLCLLLDEGGGDGYPASRLDVGLEPLGHPGDPLTADGFPTAWPIPVPEPESNAPAVPVGEGDPASRLGSRPEPRGDGTDVPVGRTSPAPRLDAVLQPGWHRRGPPRAKDQAEGGKKSPEPSGVLRQMLEELERGHETEAMRATSTPGNCCPVVSRCHPSGSLCVSRLFPQCLLLHVTSAAKAESALGRGIWSTFRR